MERSLYYLRLFPGTEERYDELHTEVPPDVINEMRAAGLRDVTLAFGSAPDRDLPFVRGDADQDADAPREDAELVAGDVDQQPPGGGADRGAAAEPAPRATDGASLAAIDGPAAAELPAHIFRAYDIRGVIDKTLDSGIAHQIGQAVGSAVLERDAGPVVVARDGRLSGPYLMKGVIEGLVSTGCDVIDIGAAPTGVLYYAAHEYAKGSAIVITGSHNPPDYNGFKIMVGGDTLHGDAIRALYERIVRNDLKTGQGKVERRNVIKNYILRIAEDIKVEKPLRVVLDCGNGIGGVCAPDVLRAIGVDVLPLYDEVDGTFPNHHPDPSEPENLRDLIDSVRLMDADLGLALDGDADRLGVVTLAGKIIYPETEHSVTAGDVEMTWPDGTRGLEAVNLSVSPGQVVAVVGPSGGGKSTRMLHMLERDHTAFLSNDRVFIRQADNALQMRGIAKLPRINPGTLLNNPRLHVLATPQQLQDWEALASDELWHLEEKYDVPVRRVYGADRIHLAGPLTSLLILNWQRDSDTAPILERVDIEQRTELLGAVMKSPGPFYQYADGRFFSDGTPFDENAYLEVLAGTPVYEVTGGIDFEAVADQCHRELLSDTP